MLTLPTQQPTQQELAAIKASAEKVQATLHSPDKRAFNEALEDFHYHAHSPAVLAMVALIDAQKKKIAELEAKASEISMPDGWVAL